MFIKLISSKYLLKYKYSIRQEELLGISFTQKA